MTNEEWESYVNIARTYDRPNFQGTDLFKGLFDTDNNGMITFIRPPSGVQTSMEIFLFVCALYEHQKMRSFEQRVEENIEQMNKKIADTLEELKNR